MNFLHFNLLIPIVVFLFIFFLSFIRKRRTIESYIQKTWFKKTTLIYKLRKISYLLGFSLLALSLLDLRGPEQKLESNIPDQKTIIIIDSSASMLAEDVRPNRFKKSILMARHFVKKAFGHKISVVLFSDTQKRLVPFTDDLDLLDARIAGLESVNLYDGGSNISQAIKESLGYFRNSAKSKEEIAGNILVFTDSEGHDEDFRFSLPKSVALGVVGVGTLKGARIPNRDRYGVFRGYKKFKNKEVITHLNETWLKSLSKKIKTYKYWVANSYTIPTEEIISFFNKNFKKRMSKGMATIRPLLVQYILIPSLILLSLVFLSYPLKSFKMICIFLFFSFSVSFMGSKETFAKDKERNPLLEKLFEKHRSGELSFRDKMKLAELFYLEKDYKSANIIYEESEKRMSIKDKNNYALSLLKSKRPDLALKLLADIEKEARQEGMSDKKLMNDLRQNMLLALRENQKQKEQQKKDNKKNNKDKNKEKSKEKNNKGKNKENKNNEKKENSKDGKKDKQKGSRKEDSQNQKKPQKNKGNKGSQDKDKKNKEKNEKKNNQRNKNDAKKDKENKSSKQKTLEEKQKEIERKRKMVKVPGLIKQLMSDDRDLQKKYIDTSTDKPKSFTKKDW